MHPRGIFGGICAYSSDIDSFIRYAEAVYET